MTIRQMLLDIVMKQSRTAQGHLRQNLPQWTSYDLDSLVIHHPDMELRGGYPHWPEPHSIRARVSELVKDGILSHDDSRPRNYMLNRENHIHVF